jgi:hypothetical protein
MNRIWKAVRYSAVGITIAGIFTTIAGCSTEDSIRAIILFIIMLLMGGSGSTEETTAGGGAAAPSAIVLFSAGTTASADLDAIGGGGGDGRVGADNICKAASIPSGIDPVSVRAFLSVSGTDQIIDLPTRAPAFPGTLPVVGPPPTMTPIAADWADLFDADDLLSSFDGATVPTTGVNLPIWTGSTASGTVSNTCSGWTAGAVATPFAAVGATSSVTGAAIIVFDEYNCNNANIAELVCVGTFTP